MASASWKDGAGHQEILVGTALVTLVGVTVCHYLVGVATLAKKQPAGTVRPPHVQSWIPYLGSAIEMGAGIVKFIRTKAKMLNDSPLFSATILGEKCIFLADSELLYMVFRPQFMKYLDIMFLQKDFMHRVMDLTEDQTDEVFGPDIIKLGMKQYHHYVFKGEELERSMGRVQDFFTANLPNLADSDKHWKQHDMFTMVVDTIFKASIGPFLSDDLVNDEALEAYRDFDKGVIPLFNKAPKIFTAKARKAREFLLRKIEAEPFWEAASPLMKERVKTFNISRAALCKANVGLAWASVGNSAPAVYWALLQLIQHPEAWNACCSQVDALVAKQKAAKGQDADSRYVFTLDDLDELTLLQSAFWEALRMYQGNFTARLVTEDFVVEARGQKYWIEKGCKLMPFWGTLHSDAAIFDMPEQFQYDRFLEKKDYTFKSGEKINFFPVVAFGGGSHLCPGRKFISYEFRLFLAMLMLNFDMQLAQGESVPGVDRTMQGVGVSHPAKEIKVEIRKRSH